MTRSGKGVVSRKQARRILCEARLPRYLVDAVLAVAPRMFTKETALLLCQYLDHRRQETPPQPPTEALAASQLGRSLHARWLSEDGAAEDLTKLIAMVDYRENARRNAIIPATGPSPADLEAFWVAGGHDLTELSGFLAKVDHESADWLPK